MRTQLDAINVITRNSFPAINIKPTTVHIQYTIIL